MPKLSLKSRKKRGEEGESFCEQGPSTTQDSLTLNDNINYHIYYERKGGVGGDSQETSLSDKPRRAFPPSPYPPASKGRAYERFSRPLGGARWVGRLPGIGSGVLVCVVLCVVCVGVWWGVWGVVGGAWGEEHYRRLWERAHHSPPHSHYSPSVIVHQQLERLEPLQPLEPKYHDHNNLSTRNRRVKQCARVTDEMRFDCFPQAEVSEKACALRGCCWVPHTKRKPPHTQSLGVPYCFYPPRYGSYRIANYTEVKRGIVMILERQFPSSYPGDVNVVAVDIKYLSNDILRIKIYDGENVRYEPPVPQISLLPGSISNRRYTVQVDTHKLGFKIIRVADDTVIFDCQDVGGFIFSERLLQLSVLLPSPLVYGLGEHQGPLLQSMQWQRLTLFNHDTAPQENKNLYGSHPFYLVMEKSGLSHGVFLFNSNAMDVILQPAPAITFRTVGGVLDLYVMLGPHPSHVISQYTSLIGRPFLPPYWALGFHLCKYGYGSLNHTREVWQRTRSAGIPFDVQWNDLDYMNNSNGFTYDHVLYNGLPQFIDTVHKAGMHYIPLIDPGVSASEVAGQYPPYDKGLEMDVFIKNSSMQPFVGKVWNKASTVWPDFTHPNATPYWLDMLSHFYKDVRFDGLWIDMNEPSNFLSGPLNGECGEEHLPYVPGVSGNQGLRSGTLCMDAHHYQDTHYNLHNLYSLTEAITTNFALKEVLGKRPFIISRSSFPGLGKYSGHWSGDIYSDWHDMKMTIPQMLSFSLFGIPMMGSDICGFNGNTTVELCKRWMELGAFYPFSRNHNSDISIEQDPVALGPEVVAASKRALIIRYTLLPYLYTLFWRAHSNGETVARPLFFEFPKDNETYSIDQQFMWGPHLLFSPVLEPNVSQVRAYVPQGPWYSWDSLAPLTWRGWGALGEGGSLLVRGGGILPLQRPREGKEYINTNTVRNKPLELLVALDQDQGANGTLFWDDGISLNTYEEKAYTLIDFTVWGGKLSYHVHWWGYGLPPLERVTVLGLGHAVTSVALNGQPVASFKYQGDIRVLRVENITILLDRAATLTWN